MATKFTHYVSASYDGYDAEKDREIRQAVKTRKDTGSGYSLMDGKRDMSFPAASYDEAKKIAKKCRTVKGVTAKVYKY